MSRIAFSPARTRLPALAAALLIAAGATGAAAAAGNGQEGGAGHRPREAAALTGTAKLYRPAGDDITFSFDAHLAAKDTMDPEAAYGTFSFRHVFPDGTSGWAKAKVDCLVTGGKVAVVTGVVTDSDTPFKGKRVGVTVHDQGTHDRLGYSWVGRDAGNQQLPKCVSSAPFEKVKEGSGDFTVLPWQPIYEQPKG
ncbi:Repetin [Streptomyces sp. SDr-06]|uniref:Repetin n=1 Tax=Streptomyces sp. SDr-06 TaxID=2267702 RepID=UPI000DE85978|nr:Repetin [Streptomyces sp. SDr-06]RCH67187.1 Repetin [Streptomyces sp. SDr-06]